MHRALDDAGPRSNGHESTGGGTAGGGLHVAIIMDGNGRWATARGRPRSAGHRAGAAAVRRVVEASPGLGIRTLTLYAFSVENWKRPHREVLTLMDLLKEYVRLELKNIHKNNIRFQVLDTAEGICTILCGTAEFIPEFQKAPFFYIGNHGIIFDNQDFYSRHHDLFSMNDDICFVFY